MLRCERRAALEGGRRYGNGKGGRDLLEEFTNSLHFCADFFTSICYNQGVFRRTECARKTAHPLRRRPIRKRRISPNPPQSLSAGFFVKKIFYNFITSSCGNFYNFVVCCLRKAEEAPMSEKKSVVGGQIREAGFGRSARRQSEDRDAKRQPQDGKDGGRNDARTGENLQAPVLSAAEALIRFRSFFVSGKHLRKILSQVGCKSVASRLQACRKSVASLPQAVCNPVAGGCPEKRRTLLRKQGICGSTKCLFCKNHARRCDSSPRGFGASGRLGAGGRRLGSGSARGGKGAAPTENEEDL